MACRAYFFDFFLQNVAFFLQNSKQSINLCSKPPETSLCAQQSCNIQIIIRSNKTVCVICISTSEMKGKITLEGRDALPGTPQSCWCQFSPRCRITGREAEHPVPGPSRCLASWKRDGKSPEDRWSREWVRTEKDKKGKKKEWKDFQPQEITHVSSYNVSNFHLKSKRGSFLSFNEWMKYPRLFQCQLHLGPLKH